MAPRPRYPGDHTGRTSRSTSTPAAATNDPPAPEPQHQERPPTVIPIEGRHILTFVLWLVGVASVAVLGMLVIGVVRLGHDLEHSDESGWSGWQCPPEAAPCEP
ncbi:hypothetical protein RCO28_18195 [Streptomyces sp. LHD-70]|uniref:hypothetical protein n=1 Tax=Streptomyces sp. LHD-70 TaxID=3072140 RepID=UPI00280E5467|nr:hypothetical protein [Streptomyces sp. LHD-70]MDQ8704405.1 hypothetical protein [Streptomyces sp. LHD-70]